ncbi:MULTISPECIES: cyclin-dependent kinase inhibitor 3 family protein [Pseudomonadaceae]|jgi:protein-tyrosine phosphatase|uniref:Protein phosphatase n=1 Tax=Ectopseudomonas oleovorans TaxID=301 RepID=A0A379JVY9_ECTOL|nr:MULTISPECIES: cyclin-dependent kinase inhibitor 3 family protein [Pseudomonadaceae]MBP8884586.1 cyclin-dependent kinase inhibitor 3 family protein [Pseudomonas sp.]MBN7118637.1 protein phosphatase [Pseudomonas oleovorans]MBN7133142.1 protein phosphatase [Pseudomonas oleovorans]MBN7139711.1 protein phosphatase [Pseudomonas oleovorans]MDG9980376.1 cyclin-dependent kinase inhibitor 3 family protein [Pseudomonas oleovorans]
MNHPYDRLSIPGIQGKLIFTPCPGTKDSSLVDSLATLKQAGASAVISLMPASELATNGAEDIGKQCQAQDMAWFHLPVADEQVPLEDFGQGWKASKQSILERLNAGQDIAIHCKGGSGRTGLIAARIMVEAGIPRADAIALVQALRPKAIQHPAHINWITQFDAAH